MLTDKDFIMQLEAFANELLKKYVTQWISEKHIIDPKKREGIESLMRNVGVRSLQSLEKRFKLYSDQCLQAVMTEGVLRTDVTEDIVAKEECIINEIKEIQRPVQGKRIIGQEPYKKALQKCRGEIVKNLNLQGSTILDQLVQDDFMSECEVESIVGKVTSRDRNEEFFRLIEGRCGQYTFNAVLLPAIQKDHSHVAETLRKEMSQSQFCETEEIDICPFCKMIDTIQVKRIANPLRDAGAISSVLHADLRSAGLSNRQKWGEVFHQVSDHRHVIEALRTKYPGLHQEFEQKHIYSLRCHCQKECNVDETQSDRFSERPESEVEMASETDVDDMLDIMSLDIKPSLLEYKMDARPRGICLIINNQDFAFDDNWKKPPPILRVGSDADTARLAHVFKKFEFKIQIMTNLTAADMVTSMKDMATKTDHSQFDCFVCCILSHGSKDVIYGTDGRTVTHTEMTQPLYASSCPSLAGKPKLFFIQASRGSLKMGGLKIAGERTKEALEKELTIPDEADFLINYSSTEGHVSYRSRLQGSWFVTKLTEMLDRYGEIHDLLGCLMMVNENVAEGNARIGDHVFKQIPAPLFTLRKRVMLSANPLWSDSLSAH